MRETFVKKSASSFFEGKKVKVLNDIHNIGEESVKAGTIVTIVGKNQRNKGWLDVKQGEIHINGVAPENLELIKELDNDWPIECDTLDIKNHEFNFNK